MAVTTDYLNELINQKTALATAISNKGIAASASEKFNTLVPKVAQIDTLKEEEVVLNDITEALDSPQSVVKLEYPIVKNLIHYTSTETTELNGITFTYNSDGSITANGTATADVYYILDNNIEVSKGTTYTLSGCTGGSSSTFDTYCLNLHFNNRDYIQGGTATSRTFTVNDTTQTVVARIFVKSDYTLNNVIFRPMLNVGDTALSFELYPSEQKVNVKLSSETITDFSTVTLIRCGKNIFNPSNWTTAQTLGGITIQYFPAEDYFLLNGSSSENQQFTVATPLFYYGLNKDFTVDVEYVSGSTTPDSRGYYGVFHTGYTNDATVWGDKLHNISLTNQNNSQTKTCNRSYFLERTWFYVYAGVTYTNYKIKIQVTCSDSSSSYSKFNYKSYVLPSSGVLSDVPAIFPTTTLLVDKPANFSSITGQFYKEIGPSSGKNAITKVWQPSCVK